MLFATSLTSTCSTLERPSAYLRAKETGESSISLATQLLLTLKRAMPPLPPPHTPPKVMDTKGILERSKSLQKATVDNEVPAILRILNELKDGVVASDALLRQTRIGVVVNRAKAHKDPAVARLASEIVRKWREVVAKETAKKGVGSGNGTASPTPGGNGPSKKPAGSGTTSPAPQPSDVAPEKRTSKTDKVDTARTDRPMRNSCIELMYNGLAYMSTIPPAKVLSVAVAVEVAAHATYGPEIRTDYKQKMRSLFQNLKNKSSTELRAKVLDGRISPAKFVVLSHEELKSEELRREEAGLVRENMRAAQAPVEEKAVSSSLTCGKCGAQKVSYTQAQTRSADEPMTTFCECMNCGRRWKVGAAKSFDGRGAGKLTMRTVLLTASSCSRQIFTAFLDPLHRLACGSNQGQCEQQNALALQHHAGPVNRATKARLAASSHALLESQGAGHSTSLLKPGQRLGELYWCEHAPFWSQKHQVFKRLDYKADCKDSPVHTHCTVDDPTVVEVTSSVLWPTVCDVAMIIVNASRLMSQQITFD